MDTINEDLVQHFAPFRNNIIGVDASIRTHVGIKPLVYLDWTAMGRLSNQVESKLLEFAPYSGNTHTDASYTGELTTAIYHESQDIIRRHVNAGEEDVVLFKGSGMTGTVNWLQRALGLRDGAPKSPERRSFLKRLQPSDATKTPVVLITHMEHHSNQTSWEECNVEVQIVLPGPDGFPDLNDLEAKCRHAKSQGRPLIGSFTACSNVTGVSPDFHAMAEVIHRFGGKCFVDFAASAPYVKINMRPSNPDQALDAIYFSPHKFLGGPGSSGVIVFSKDLYPTNRKPVDIGGGIVSWTNPWGGHSFYSDVHAREDAGTPPIFQAYKAALAIGLKDKMGAANIHTRKSQLLEKAFKGLDRIAGVELLAPSHRDRQGIVSFLTRSFHYGLLVRVLSDYFGVQVRGGCSCAGTYGHFLFGIDERVSKEITDEIDHGDNTHKPGWTRVSLHPTMTDSELDLFISAVDEVLSNPDRFMASYFYKPCSNTWVPKIPAEASNPVSRFFI